MRSSACLELINDMEQIHPVLSWMVDDTHLWPLIRAELWWANNQDYASKREEAAYERAVLRRARQIRQAAVGGVTHLIAQSRSSGLREQPGRVDAVFLGDSVSRIWINSRWYDRICEPLIEQLEARDITTLQLEPYHLHRVPTNRPCIFIQRHIDRAMFRALLKAPTPLTLPGYELFLADLRSRGAETSSLSQRALQRRVTALQTITSWFVDFLRRVAPKAAFIVDYNLTCMALHLACRALEIPSVELQHGVVSHLHWEYGPWTKVPPEGYAILPRYFWLWSEHEVAIVNGWSVDEHRAILGSNLWLDRWTQSSDPLIQKSDRLIEKGLAAQRRRTVLVTLQSGFAERERLQLLADTAEATPELTWWIRCHPVMSKTEKLTTYDVFRRICSRSFIDEISELPLYALLRHTDVHLTHNSSVVREAAAFGLPSVVTDASASEMYPDLLAQGFLQPVESRDHLIEFVCTVQKRPAVRATEPRASIDNLLLATGLLR